ncbi:hypothetical protein CPB85DRAFT_1258783 [Mucidula mucida]|nr:hypothetical protein CPB85DRAFT_1258783 [Mucidula mucida]
MRIHEYCVERMTETIHAESRSALFDAASSRTSYPLACGMLDAVAQGDAMLPETDSTTPLHDGVLLHIATNTFVPGVQLPCPRPTPQWAVTPNVPNGRARRVHRGLPSQIGGGGEAVMHPLPQRVPDVNSVDFSQTWEIVKAAWPPSSLCKLATGPRPPLMAVVVHLLPWPIVIQPDANQYYVTVGDVVFRIWECLHFPLDGSITLSQSRQAVEREDLFEMRSTWRARTDEEPRHTKHLVYLRGRTRFMGLNKKAHDGDTWATNME